MKTLTPIKKVCGDLLDFAYMFPGRKQLPKVEDHPLLLINREGDERAGRLVAQIMMDPNYFGWTVKALMNIDLFPQQVAILRTLWTTPFPMFIGCRGLGKTFILAVYIMLRALLDQGSKIVIIGAGLRQAKLVFGYVESIWANSPMLKSIIGGGAKARPRHAVEESYFMVGQSRITALPLGAGTKIRGYRANVVVADEFASIPPEIFDIVIRGFVSTSKSPVEEAKRLAMEQYLRANGVEPEAFANEGAGSFKGNQIVYAGTAFYSFNHFAQRFETWHRIISSNGDPQKIVEIFGSSDAVPDGFNWRDYAIIRIPYTHAPKGLLDLRQLAHSRAVLPKSFFLMEYGAVFAKDSEGFFQRSLLETCTPSTTTGVTTPDGVIIFSPLLYGVRSRRYIIGIDPASERDNFAIVIIECWGAHARIVYCWTTNKARFAKYKSRGFTHENDYYAFCCAKVRDLVKRFGPIRIEMDSQGGGYVVAEMLRDKRLLAVGTKPIYPTIDFDKPTDFDGETDGPHLLHLVTQTNDWNAQSNVFLHKAFETRALLFPAIDPLRMQAAVLAEQEAHVEYDTYDDCVQEIEELKNELCLIQLGSTATGRDRFGTPTIKAGTEGALKVGRLRKDRYSALLLAYRHLHDVDTPTGPAVNYDDVIGNIERVKATPGEPMYRGPGLGGMVNGDWAKGGFGGGMKNGEIIR